MPYSELEHIGWKKHAVAIMRMTVTAVITTVIIIAGIVVTDIGHSKEQTQIAETLVHTNLANACVLALPVDPDEGRDPAAVEQCFTQYHLEPPILQVP